MKACTGPCGQVLPLSEFYKDQKSRDGHRARCKTCSKETKTMAAAPKKSSLKPLSAAQVKALNEELAGVAQAGALPPAPAPEPARASIEIVVGDAFTGRLTVRVSD